MVQKLKITKKKKVNKKLLEEAAKRFAEILVDELERKKIIINKFIKKQKSPAMDFLKYVSCF